MHPQTKLQITTLALAIGTLLPAVADSSWPTFHGPKRDNLVSETGLLTSWPKDGPKLLWTFSACGKGYSAVSIANGLMFLSGDFGNEEMVLALDLAGKLRWKVPNGKAWNGAQPGARTTPTYDDGLVYHLGPHGTLTAFEAGTGKCVWTIDIRQQFSARLGLWGYTEKVSLTYADGHLYCFDNDGDMLLVKATPQAATVISRFKFPRADNQPTLTHPVVCGGRLYLRHLNDLVAYDIRARE